MKKQKLKFVLMSKEIDNIDPTLFEAYKTGKPIDMVLSDDGGIMKATVTMVVGDPGVGKTTITNDILAELKKNYKGLEVLFISSEESQIDRAYSYLKTPKTGDTPTLFLGDYEDKVTAVEDSFDKGWDIIVVDSFKDTQDKIRIDMKLGIGVQMTSNQAELWLLNTMVDTACGKNKKKKYTAFLCIQQVTKGAIFSGSNALKHNTTGMMEIRFDKDDITKRYVEFTKNRRAGKMVNYRVYYAMDKKGNIVYEKPQLPPAKGKKKAKVIVLKHRDQTFLEVVEERYRQRKLDNGEGLEE